MKGLYCTLTMLLLLVSISGFGQSKKLTKANELYKLKNFSEAIPLYEQVVKKKPTITSRSRLAYCYKMLNQSDKAEKLYAELVKEEKSKDINQLYYGEILMSNEKYKEAEKWLIKYSNAHPDDEGAMLLAIAASEVDKISPVFTDVKLKNFTQNAGTDDNAPVFYNGGVVFASDRPQGIKIMKQKSGATGRDFIRLYYSKQNVDGTFEPASPFSGKINEFNKNTGPITFTANGKYAVFSKNSNEANKAGAYSLQLYSAETSDGNKWRNVERLSFCNLGSNYMHPAISPDGNTLFFVSKKGRGIGGTDIYVTEKTDKGWSKPSNLGATINTVLNEGFPFMDQSGKLYFCSKGHPGYGGFDIFYTKKNENGNWEKPVNVGQPINSSKDDISLYVYPEGNQGIFTSNRKNGDDDIFFFLPKDADELADTPNLLTETTTIVEPEPVATPVSESTTQSTSEEYVDNTTMDTGASPEKISSDENPVVDQPKQEEKKKSTSYAEAMEQKRNALANREETEEDGKPKKITSYTEALAAKRRAQANQESTIDTSTESIATTTTKEERKKRKKKKNKNKKEQKTKETISTAPIESKDQQTTTNNTENVPSETIVTAPSTTETMEEIPTEIAEEQVETVTDLPEEKVVEQPVKKAPTPNLQNVSPSKNPELVTTKKEKKKKKKKSKKKKKDTEQVATIPVEEKEISTTNNPEVIASETTPDLPATPTDLEETEIAESTTPPATNNIVDQPQTTNPETTEMEPVEEVVEEIPEETPSFEMPKPVPTPEEQEAENFESTGIVGSQPKSTTKASDPVFIEATPEYETNEAPAAPVKLNGYDAFVYALVDGNVSLGQTFTMPNIKYPFNQFSYKVTNDIAIYVDQLYDLLRNNPNLRIEIGGHTESYGEDSVNQMLSRYRTDHIVDYLVSKGIDKGRLSARGYGEENLLNTCTNGTLCSKDQHLENQRIEIKVLGL